MSYLVISILFRFQYKFIYIINYKISQIDVYLPIDVHKETRVISWHDLIVKLIQGMTKIDKKIEI